MQSAGPDRPYAEPPRPKPSGPDRPRRGRDVARPRTRADAAGYLATLTALHAGLVSLVVIDTVRPGCAAADCAGGHPGLGWPLFLAAFGFVGLVLVARRLTRRHDLARRGGRRRGSARGWLTTWNYLAAGLLVGEAVRVLRGAADRERPDG